MFNQFIVTDNKVISKIELENFEEEYYYLVANDLSFRNHQIVTCHNIPNIRCVLFVYVMSGQSFTNTISMKRTLSP